MCDKISCSYAYCDASLSKELMTEVGDEGDYLCPDCLIKFENGNDTGYCGMSCLLGYGCDQSC